MSARKKYTFIDLFAGCGGLSEGFLQTGKSRHAHPTAVLFEGGVGEKK